MSDEKKSSTATTAEEVLEEMNAIGIFCVNRLARLSTVEEQSRLNGAQVLALGALFEKWLRQTPEQRDRVLEGVKIIADNLVELERIDCAPRSMKST